MKTIIYTKFGTSEVLRLVDTAKPVPGSDEVLIKVRATTMSKPLQSLMER